MVQLGTYGDLEPFDIRSVFIQYRTAAAPPYTHGGNAFANAHTQSQDLECDYCSDTRTADDRFPMEAIISHMPAPSRVVLRLCTLVPERARDYLTDLRNKSVLALSRGCQVGFARLLAPGDPLGSFREYLRHGTP